MHGRVVTEYLNCHDVYFNLFDGCCPSIPLRIPNIAFYSRVLRYINFPIRHEQEARACCTPLSFLLPGNRSCYPKTRGTTRVPAIIRVMHARTSPDKISRALVSELEGDETKLQSLGMSYVVCSRAIWPALRLV